MPSNASICIKKCLSYVMNVAIAVKPASNRPNVVKRTLTVTQSNGWLIDGPCVQLFGLYSLVVDGEAASVHASPRRHGLSTLARLVATRKHMSPYSTISIETRRCHISPHPAYHYDAVIAFFLLTWVCRFAALLCISAFAAVMGLGALRMDKRVSTQQHGDARSIHISRIRNMTRIIPKSSCLFILLLFMPPPPYGGGIKRWFCLTSDVCLV